MKLSNLLHTRQTSRKLHIATETRTARRALCCERLEARCMMSADPVLDWNAIALDAVRKDHTPVFGAPEQGGPTASSRALAMVHAAIFDAVNSVDRSYTPYLTLKPTSAGTSLRAAVAQAAHDTLSALYPRQRATFSAELQDSLNEEPNARAELLGRSLGKYVAQAILRARRNDGASAMMDYTLTPEPGHHQPDPLHPSQGFLGPDWGHVKPFAIDDVLDFRAVPPPALTSQEYADAFNEVRVLGAIDAETSDRDGDGVFDRTPEQTQIGIYWAYDGVSGLGTPPVLYNQMVRAIAAQQGNTIIENARLLALVNIAQADAGIASWDSKYAYDLWRPVVAIRQDGLSSAAGGLDGNVNTTGEADWKPLGAPASNGTPGGDFTPPFPAYTSGHATFGASVFKTLEKFYGTNDISFSFMSDELNGVTTDYNGVVRGAVTRHFTSFSHAAEENAHSRVYLGVHWDFDCTAGKAQGNAVAESVFAEILRPIAPPVVEFAAASSSSAGSGATAVARALAASATPSTSIAASTTKASIAAPKQVQAPLPAKQAVPKPDEAPALQRMVKTTPASNAVDQVFATLGGAKTVKTLKSR